MKIFVVILKEAYVITKVYGAYEAEWKAKDRVIEDEIDDAADKKLNNKYEIFAVELE